MAAVAGVSITTPKVFAKLSDSSKPHPVKFSLLNSPWKRCTTQLSHGRMYVRPVAAAPDQISDKVQESIKNAQETCSDDPVSGECAAAWDEVEELSAAASHARDKQKESDPLENYFVTKTPSTSTHTSTTNKPMQQDRVIVCPITLLTI